MIERKSRWQAFYKVVRRIPKGSVATYGQVAEIAGFPRHARQVGYALHALTRAEARRTPWHRVINARGEVSERAAHEADRLQRAILESEGVLFSTSGRVDLGRFGWRPGRRRGSRPRRATAPTQR